MKLLGNVAFNPVSALTGATNVQIVLRDQDSGSWYLPPLSNADAARVLSIAEAGRQRLLPDEFTTGGPRDMISAVVGF